MPRQANLLLRPQYAVGLVFSATMFLAAAVSCVGDSSTEPATSVPSRAWTANEAIAHLAEQLYLDALAEIEAMGEAGQRLIANGYFPSKRATGHWVATQDEDGSWLVDTGVRLYRVFESGVPFTLVETYPTPTIPPTIGISTVIASLPTSTPLPSINTPVRIFRVKSFYSGGRIVNCILTDVSESQTIVGGGTRAHIIETEYECIPQMVQIQLEDGSKYWVELSSLLIDQ